MDLRESPLILQAHMFLHVLLHPHYTITNLFLVSLNERESQGTAANGCYFTVVAVGILSSPAESHLALDTQIPTFTVYGETPVRKLQLSRTAFYPHNLQFRNSDLSKLNTCNTTGITLHVSTNFQHVSFIMLAKSDHVATVVASVNLLVAVVFVLPLHCLYQWNEGFECSLPQHFNFAKADLQDSIRPGLNWFFQNETLK